MQLDKRILHDIAGAVPVTAEEPGSIARQRTFEIRLGGFYKLARRNFHDLEHYGGHECDDYIALNARPGDFLVKKLLLSIIRVPPVHNDRLSPPSKRNTEISHKSSLENHFFQI